MRQDFLQRRQPPRLPVEHLAAAGQNPDRTTCLHSSRGDRARDSAGEIDLKGFSRPVPAYEVRELRTD